MSVDKPSAIVIPEPTTVTGTLSQALLEVEREGLLRKVVEREFAYARGGKGNPRIIGWQISGDPIPLDETQFTIPVKSVQVQEHKHSYYVGKPRLVNRRGRIIRHIGVVYNEL